MRIGLINQLNGRPDGKRLPPTWESISARTVAAEDAGFDIFVFEDALLYRWEENGTDGVWESVSVAAAVAATTSKMRIAHSVINSPYRSPAMMASIATTLDEISAGRYTLGIGAGNTLDSDYEAFGFPKDHRYTRFAEAIQIIHSLLKTGRVDFEGEFYSARDSELVLRGPSPSGPPINIAAGGPKMMSLVAQYADEWNWWGWDETLEELRSRLSPILATLDHELEGAGRESSDLVRTLDVYSVQPADLDADHDMKKPIVGTSEQIAEQILAMGEMGFDEVRVDLWPKSIPAIEAMTEVVSLVHEG
jgi:alkanesulfonate monooxygenase SsuD/methylene tetrahydromethanopterin reductase-like flavin-dependent oxidoreductase (luciferase family)